MVKDVGGRHQPDHGVVLGNEQASNRAPAHQVGGLTKRRLGAGAHDVGRHDFAHEAPVQGRRRSFAAEVALRHDSRCSCAIDDDEVANAVLPHPGPCGTHEFIGADGDYSSAHDFL
ncbi:MAG TPA: hypothetical protein PLH72_03190 [Vicinamibacterales bacterium]|nr:hypothetical protein [Vicinamibacterales bacterium]